MIDFTTPDNTLFGSSRFHSWLSGVGTLVSHISLGVQVGSIAGQPSDDDDDDDDNDKPCRVWSNKRVKNDAVGTTRCINP